MLITDGAQTPDGTPFNLVNGFKIGANGASFKGGQANGRTVTASSTLVATDSCTTVFCNHATVPIVLTIPDETVAAWNGQEIITLYQQGAAAASFAAGANVTLDDPLTLPAPVQFGFQSIVRIGTNHWARA